MKLKFMVTIVSAVIITNAYAAASYNVEAGLQYANSNTDDKTSQKIMSIAGTYYLQSIANDPSQPFAEMDFLQKASSLNLLYSNINYESNTFASTTINPISFGGNFYADKFSFGASTSSWGNTNFNFKSNSSHYIGIKSTKTNFNFGYFVTPTTLVSFVNSKESANYSPSAGLSAVNDLTVTTNGLKSHTVTSLSGSESIAVDLAYNQIRSEQDTSQSNVEYGLNVRYYPEANYYFEGGYKINSGDYAADKGNTYSLGAGIKLTPNFGLMLTTSKFSVSDSTQNSGKTSTVLTAGYRF